MWMHGLHFCTVAELLISGILWSLVLVVVSSTGEVARRAGGSGTVLWFAFFLLRVLLSC